MYLTERLNGIPLYTEDFIPLCFLLIVICLLEWCIPRRLGYRSTVSHQILKIVFAVYLLVLFEMTVSLESLWLSFQAGFPIKGQQMLTPFREIRNFWFYGSKDEILVNLCGNVLVFIPMGLLPPLLWKWARWPWSALLWAVVPSCVIEFLQLFTPRSTSVDDVILNVTGVILGYLLFWLLWLCGLGKRTMLQKRSSKKTNRGQ